MLDWYTGYSLLFSPSQVTKCSRINSCFLHFFYNIKPTNVSLKLSIQYCKLRITSGHLIYASSHTQPTPTWLQIAFQIHTETASSAQSVRLQGITAGEKLSAYNLAHRTDPPLCIKSRNASTSSHLSVCSIASYCGSRGKLRCDCVMLTWQCGIKWTNELAFAPKKNRRM